MMDISTILLPLDFSETSEYAIESARKMAQLFQATITPFHAYMPVSDLYAPGMYGLENTPMASQNPDELEKIYTANLQNEVKEYIPDQLLNPVKVAAGKSAQAIVEAAKQTDIIVMGSHGRSGFTRFFMGSVSDKVLRTASVPVVVVNEKQQFNDIDQMMVTTDFSEYSRSVFPIAKDMALKTGAEIELIHVLSFNKNDPDAPTSSLKELRQHHLNIVEKEHFHELGNQIKSRLIISSDSPHEAIMNDNLNNPHDLILMATVGRTGIGHLMMGSTTSQVVRHVQSPVLSINPKVEPKSINE